MTRLAIGPDGMTIGTAAIAGRPAGTAGWTKAFQADLVVSLGTALALTGLAELFLQRVVYRVGVHIPREGAFLEAYRFATFAGDFAFRLAAALLLLTTAAAVDDGGVAGAACCAATVSGAAASSSPASHG